MQNSSDDNLCNCQPPCFFVGHTMNNKIRVCTHSLHIYTSHMQHASNATSLYLIDCWHTQVIAHRSLQHHNDIITPLPTAIHLLNTHRRTWRAWPILDNAIEKCRVCNCFNGEKQTIQHFYCLSRETSIDFGSLHRYAVSFFLAMLRHCSSSLRGTLSLK